MVDTISLMMPEETKINIEFINAVKESKGWKNLIHPEAKKYRFTISNYLSIGSSLSGIFLNIQLPQVFHENNLYILNREEACNSFKKIGDDIRPYILNSEDFTIFDLEPVRIDLFKDIKPDYSYLNYEEPLKLLSAYRMDRKLYKNTNLLGNKKEEITFYDKKEQLQKVKKIHLPDIDNLMRVELRLKNRLSVQKHIGIITVQDLIENWHELDSLYNKYLDDKIFKYNDFRSGNTILLPSADLKKMTISQMKNVLFLKELNSMFGSDIEKVKDYLNSIYKRESVRKKLKEFKKYCADTIEISTKVKIIDLINEIHEKLKE